MGSTALRAWRALVDKVSKMDIEAVRGQDHVFRFSSVGSPSILIRIKSEHNKYEDGVEVKTVELLDETGKVLAREWWCVSHSLFAKNQEHPLDEFFELIAEGESSGRKLQEIQAIQKLLVS